MRKRVPLGAYLPDLPPSDQLVVCENAYPAATGYISVGSFNAITPALPSITGGGAFISSTGETSFLGGDRNSLNRYSSGAWSGLFVAITAERWRFAQFGDSVVSVYGGAPIRYRLDTGTAALLAGDPPAADLVATVGDFVVLAGDQAALDTVTWSGFNNAEFWPATDPTNPDQQQSDSQKLPDGGAVMGLAGGEYGIVLQKNAVKRMSYQGGEVIFSFAEIASNVGCMAKGSVAQSGRLVFFLSERGFMVCDGNDVRPIGAEKVDRTFFASYGRQDIVNGIYAACDPARNIVVWAMPGVSGVLWGYNYALDRWFTVRTDVRLVFPGFTANVSLEGIDVLYGNNIDAVPVSLDDPVFAGGNPLLLVATTAGVVGALEGAAMAATLGTARMELATGRARVRTVTPVTDATDVTLKIEGRSRGGSTPAPEYSGDMRRNGDIPMRVNAHLFAFAHTLRAPWSYMQGFDVDYEPAGLR